MSEPPSSPPSGDARPEDALSWYKAQYEQLEQDLAEFRDSSKELEAELEKDLDAADKRERTLREKAEALEYEVEEWKRKYKESKAEANAAQNTLEKEVTTLRESNRTLQLKLRDIEVANDDFERQARNTTMSLEELDSKYNVSIERGVLLEEEIKMGEQERENLRVESQRLREELSDLKIEAEILQDKLKKQEARHLSAISTDISVPESPTFDNSPNSTASSPLITTPPDTKSVSVDMASDPSSSPRLPEASVPLPKPSLVRTPAPKTARRSRLPSTGNSVTPRAKALGSSLSSSTARPLGTRAATTSGASRTSSRTSTAASAARATPRSTSHKIPSSTSLSHIRSLTAQMQRLEARVQSARSKLPGPVNTPPRASPRSSVLGGIPSTVTVRSRKRGAGSTASSVTGASVDSTPTPANNNSHFQPRSSVNGGGSSKHVPRLSTSGVSRLSFGPLPNRSGAAVAGADSEYSSRPSSRASVSSYARPGSRTEGRDNLRDLRDMPPPRPMSRTSLSGTRTPLGRPRSSLGGATLHGHTMSMSMSMGMGGTSTATSIVPEDEVLADQSDFGNEFRSPSRRSTYSKLELDALVHGNGSAASSTSGIPGPSGIPAPTSGIPKPGSRRQSAGSNAGFSGIPALGRRMSTNFK